MADKKPEDLGTFRIADVKRPEVRSYRKIGKEPEPEQAPSVGFPAIESRVEGMTIEQVVEEIRPSYEQLEEMAAKGDMKSRAAAKKAMAAYERTADLFEYLYYTKDALQGRGK
jgi:hypothetical protein